MSHSARSRRLAGSRRNRRLSGWAAATEAAAAQLAGHANVLYVSVGEKRVRGEETGRIALIAYVTEKIASPGPERIPDTVVIRMPDGGQVEFATDVVQLPSPPRTLGLRSGHVILAGDGDFGTCGYTFRRGPAAYALTNSHVVSNLVTGNLPGEPAVQDPASLQGFRIGKTIYASAVQPGVATEEDLAIIRADLVEVDVGQISGELHPIARVSGFAQSGASQFWYKINGGKILCGRPEPVVGNAIINVDGGRFLYRKFWHLRVLQGAIAPGHSGALICTGNGQNIAACGLLFGGAVPNYAYAFSMDDVLGRVDAVFAEYGI